MKAVNAKAFVGDMQTTVAQRSYAVASEANKPANPKAPETKETGITDFKDIEDAAQRGATKAINGAGVYIDKKPAGKILAPVINDELGKINNKKT